MTPHQCKYESDIAVMGEKIGSMESDLKKILSHIEGNGKKGLLERMARLEIIAVVAVWAGRLVGGAIISGACWGVWMIVKKVVLKS